MSIFKEYVRTNIAEMTPVVEGVNYGHYSISKEDEKNGSPKKGDMIARNPNNHKDKWLVSKDYFEANFKIK